MRLLIRMSRCTHGVHLSRFKLTQPRLLWLDHRLTLSAALRRKRQSTGVRPSVQPAPAFPLSSPGATVSVLPCSPLRGLSVVCAHSTTGRARTFTHTPVAFASSSAASSPTPTESVKTQTETEEGQTPTTLPVEDVRRILQLAHPERWSLAGRLCDYTTNVWTSRHRLFILMIRAQLPVSVWHWEKAPTTSMDWKKGFNY